MSFLFTQETSILRKSRISGRNCFLKKQPRKRTKVSFFVNKKAGPSPSYCPVTENKRRSIQKQSMGLLSFVFFWCISLQSEMPSWRSEAKRQGKTKIKEIVFNCQLFCAKKWRKNKFKERAERNWICVHQNFVTWWILQFWCRRTWHFSPKQVDLCAKWTRVFNDWGLCCFWVLREITENAVADWRLILSVL